MEPEALPPWVDLTRANAARMYDYLLGGGHNFAVDREQAAKVVAGYPGIAAAARANRAYLGRVVRWCLERGITQFLDLGSGVPTVGNVHEIALPREPSARVAYVDVEPVAAAHTEQIVAGVEGVSITRADLRDAAAVLAAPGVAGLLDLTRPVALLAVAVLHFVPGDLRGAVGAYRSALAPGSVVALSHGGDDHDDPVVAAQMHAVRDGVRGSTSEMTLRGRAELRALLEGLELVEPGIVDITEWPAPGARAAPVGSWAAVAVV